MARRLTVADFFCGAGGWSEGFRQSGVDLVFALDYWGPAVDTHHLNHPKAKTVKMNILELDTPEKIDSVVPDTDVIVGSPPCVAFSHSNRAGKADKSLGVQLIEAYLRIVLWKKNKGVLKYWAMENVPNSSLHVKQKYTWKELGLPGKGPDLEIPVREILVAADYGAPQSRKRFVCGNYPVPRKTHSQEQWVSIAQVKKGLHAPGEKARTVTDPVYGFSIPANKLTDHFYDTTVQQFEWERAKRLKIDHGFMGKMSFPEDESRPSRTIMATRSASTREAMLLAKEDSKGYRLPTIREVATFMSFPITYQFEASSEANKYRLVGNAVCVKMSAAIAKAILEKEKMKLPDAFISLPEVKPSFDLTGTMMKAKEAKSRASNSKFSTHVPGLKVRGFRVELTNKGSDFENNKLSWKCALHYGSGKGAVYTLMRSNMIASALSPVPEFSKFQELVKKEFGKEVPDATEMQMRYAERTESENALGPETVLVKIKKLVDAALPESKYAQTMFSNKAKKLFVERPEVPLRVVFAYYALQYFTEQMKKNNLPALKDLPRESQKLLLEA